MLKNALIDFFMDAAKVSREEAAEAAKAMVIAIEEGRLDELLKEAGVAGRDPIR